MEHHTSRNIGHIVGKVRNFTKGRLLLSMETEPGNKPELRLTILTNRDQEYIQLTEEQVTVLQALIQHRNSIDNPY